MRIEDIKRSVLEMNKDEALNLVLSIRKSRRSRPAEATKVVRGKSHSERAMIKKMTPDQLFQLLKELSTI